MPANKVKTQINNILITENADKYKVKNFYTKAIKAGNNNNQRWQCESI